MFFASNNRHFLCTRIIKSYLNQNDFSQVGDRNHPKKSVNGAR